jgi:hypothetical protein
MNRSLKPDATEGFETLKITDQIAGDDAQSRIVRALFQHRSVGTLIQPLRDG